MTILLKSMATQFCSLFDILFFAKCNKLVLLQIVTVCYYKVRQVLQYVTDFITTCVRFLKV